MMILTLFSEFYLRKQAFMQAEQALRDKVCEKRLS